ncbi:hypothetical protein MIB43_017150 [Providencia rettgeri]|uniref:hypothetical protein n=1 Tax=Providencia rettgeri TaxID=587 RepID=UPI001F03DC95|nr:hypothetical protein [Providencia rettgeri]MCG9951640.1 hypothetical protein [Providencia rettgeri]
MKIKEMSLNEYLQSRLIASGFSENEVTKVLNKLDEITNADEGDKGFTAAQLWGMLDKTAPITLCDQLINIANKATADGQYNAAVQALELLHREFSAEKWFKFILNDFH